MLTPELRAAFCQDIVLLDSVGIKPVVVHGGGPQITELIAKLGLKSRFVRGMRVTDEPTMEAAEMVLQRLNKEIAALISRHGGRAVGLSGKDSELMVARQMRMVAKGEDGKLEQVDIGLVGEIDTINPGVLTTLRDGGFIPIIAPIGIGREGQTYNINADVAAGKIAGALRAEKLILLTDVQRRAGRKSWAHFRPGRRPRTSDDRVRHDRRGHDSEGRMLHRRAERRGSEHPHYRRAAIAFGVARDFHSHRHRH